MRYEQSQPRGPTHLLYLQRQICPSTETLHSTTNGLSSTSRQLWSMRFLDPSAGIGPTQEMRMPNPEQPQLTLNLPNLHNQPTLNLPNLHNQPTQNPHCQLTLNLSNLLCPPTSLEDDTNMVQVRSSLTSRISKPNNLLDMAGGPWGTTTDFIDSHSVISKYTQLGILPHF